MATAEAAVATEAVLEPDDLYRMPLDVYRSMGELGLLLPDDRVELLDGLLVKKLTKYPRPTTATHGIFMRFVSALPAGWYPRQEQPIELPGGPRGDSAPEPDVAVVAGAFRDYSDRHPGPTEVALLVQVARDARALRRDRKGLARYAWANIPAVWIVNLPNSTVEVYTAPSGAGPNPRYGQCDLKKPGDSVTITIGGTVIAIPVDEMVR